MFQRPGARDLGELALALALGLWYRTWSELALGRAEILPVRLALGSCS